jgi:hypothetical protein
MMQGAGGPGSGEWWEAEAEAAHLQRHVITPKARLRHLFEVLAVAARHVRAVPLAARLQLTHRRLPHLVVALLCKTPRAN